MIKLSKGSATTMKVMRTKFLQMLGWWWGAREGAGELSIALGRPYQSTRYTTIIVTTITIIVATIKMAMKHIWIMVSLPGPTLEHECHLVFGHNGPVLATWEILSYTDTLCHWGHSWFTITGWSRSSQVNLDEDDSSGPHLLELNRPGLAGWWWWWW